MCEATMYVGRLSSSLFEAKGETRAINVAAVATFRHFNHWISLKFLSILKFN